MLTALNIHRRLFLSLLLVSYLFGTFPQVVFEGLHLGAHTVELIHHTYQEHSLYGHGHDHHHVHLEMAQQQQEQQEHTVSLDDLKKKIEISDQVLAIHLIKTEATDNKFGVLLTLKTSCCKPLSPPPRLFLS